MSATQSAPVLEVSDCQLNIHFSAPGFDVPDPDSVKKQITAENTLFNWGGIKIARILPNVAVKFGSHVTVMEAKTMLFVSQNTRTVPVPKIYAYYTHGPIDRDVEECGSAFDTYIFMSFVEGQTLEKAWWTFDEATKQNVADQLKGYLNELRGITSPGYIGSVDFGPVTDQLLENHSDRGPFDSEQDFDKAIIDAYQKRAPKRHIKSFLSGMLSQNKHRVVFTHGDLRLANIMVHNGSVSGIVDWEQGGWYPEHWEFCRALHIWQWQHDWTDYMLQVFQPYYPEYAIQSILTEDLW
ncbi:kinase-like protein [Aspergillus venezuelensis]